MSDQNAELRSVVVAEAIRSHLLIVAVFTIAGFALGYFAANRGEESSTATTPILVNPLEGNPYYPTRTGELLTNLLTEAQAVRSDGVAALAAEQLGDVEDPAVLLSGLGVTSPVNTQILEIAYTHTDPDVALRRSQAIAEVYLDYRRTRVEDRIAQQTAQLDAQIEPLTQQIADVGTQLEAVEPGSAEAQLLLTQITSLEEQRGLLQTRRSELAATPTDPGQVITPASLDASGLLSSKLLLPIAGTIFGFACGVIVAMLRSRADLNIRDAQDVRDLGVVVLGTLGGVDAGRDDVAGEEILDDQYRKIRVAILALEKRRPFSLVVASAREDGHSPGAAVDLAIYFARAGLDTILIDATEHGDGPAHVLAPDDHTGLTEVLLGNTILTSALAPVAPMLWVLAPGHDVAGMSDLFVSGEMAELLARAKQRSDVVIVASGSIQHADGQSLASMSDAIVVEVEEDRATRTEVARARHTLEVLPCTLLGAIYVGGDVNTARARLPAGDDDAPRSTPIGAPGSTPIGQHAGRAVRRSFGAGTARSRRRRRRPVDRDRRLRSRAPHVGRRCR